ncbi:NACHT domain-containing protein [Streptomyces sp. IBSBF 3352]|uniref:NACHT domain-containing protein n=1 Tax=Streptomyces sp. IBSBF 3352 TaxID=2903523 RepID=UPI002FDBA2BF
MHLERFCVPVGEALPLDSDGFLQEPTAWSRLTRERFSPVTVTQACTRSAVLLGEAGIGKSYALAAVLDRKQTSLTWETEARVDLGQVRTWEDLTRKARPVLERLTALPLSATNGPQNDEQVPRFLLVLDGVDECQATDKEIAGWFTDLAAAYDCRPLHVLIACRTMAYTDALRQATARAFAITDSDTYTLAPLRRSDLITAASGKNLSPDRFLHAVTTSGAQALARTPLTLKLLLETFAADNALPASRNALYGFALPRAVMNQGKDRDPAELAGTQEQRFATAARLACYCLLTGAEGVTSLRPDRTDRHLLPLDTFLDAEEGVPSGRFVIERPILASVLHSPLFTSRGHAAAGPAHASIASYLTARYLTDHQLGPGQLKGLLVHRGEIGEAGIPGDLHELAAWLVALNPDLGPWLIGTDPEAIASYSSYIDDAHCRKLIVDGLLRQSRHNTSRNGPWWRTGPLQHSDLPQQLRQALHDATTRSQAGDTQELELVFALITGNQTTELLPDVAAVALDPQQSHLLRRLAAQITVDLDRDIAAGLLKPILAELAQRPSRDPLDGLRGIVLEACRPQLTTAELLAALTPPHTEYSRYSRFCRSLPASLGSDEITPFLSWAADHLIPADSPWSACADTETMVQTLLDRALAGPAAENHIPDVAALLHAYLRTYPRLAVPAPLCAPVNDPDDPQSRRLRRLLVQQLITLATDVEDALLLAEGWNLRPPSRTMARPDAGLPAGAEREERSSLLDAADLAWLVELELFLSEAKAPHAVPALQYVWSLTRTTDAGQDIAWATQGTRVWDQAFAVWFDAVPVKGEIADRLRARETRRRAQPGQWEGRAEYAEYTPILLARAEAGDTDSFVDLCRNLLHDPETGTLTAISTDLLTAPGTAILPTGHVPRLRAAAQHFVTESRPTDDGWIGTPSLPWRPWAAVLAFTLLDHSSALPALAPNQWRAWAPTLVAFPTEDTSTAGRASRQRLLQAALPHAPEELQNTFESLARASYAANRTFSELELAASIWTPTLEDQFLRLLTELTEEAHRSTSEPATGPDRYAVLAALLSWLLQYAAPTIRRKALDQFGMPLREPSPTRVTGLDAAYLGVFLTEAPEEIWPTAEPRLRSDHTVLDAVTQNTLHPRSTAPWITALPTEAVADLARILLTRHPPTDTSDDPFPDHGPGCRDAVLAHLASRGTAEAVTRLRTLRDAWPQASPLRTLVREAEHTHRETSWIRPTAPELDQLIRNPNRRLIKDGTDLLDLVVTLLKAIQHDLTTGTLPAAILWNETSLEIRPDGTPGKQRLRFAKDENLISDYLAHALRRDLTLGGILINREVQVNRNTKGAGDRIDLLLQAPAAPDPARAPRLPQTLIAQVAIEVKGNWHDKLKTAMETQLADDYLPTLGTRQGLYLIAYFPRDQWTASERTRPPASQTLAAVQATYDAQAAQLSERRSLDLRAVVLDCSIPTPAQRNA